MASTNSDLQLTDNTSTDNNNHTHSIAKSPITKLSSNPLNTTTKNQRKLRLQRLRCISSALQLLDYRLENISNKFNNDLQTLITQSTRRLNGCESQLTYINSQLINNNILNSVNIQQQNVIQTKLTQKQIADPINLLIQQLPNTDKANKLLHLNNKSNQNSHSNFNANTNANASTNNIPNDISNIINAISNMTNNINNSSITGSSVATS